MKHIKTYKIFESEEIEYNVSDKFNLDYIIDIFTPVTDFGLVIDSSSAIEVDNNIISIRLLNNGVVFNNNFLDELDNSIEHFKSVYNSKLKYILIVVPGYIYVRDVNDLKRILSSGDENFADTASAIDIVFEF